MKLSGVKSFLLQRGDTSWHIPFVASIAKITQPKVCVEIGIYQASTLNAFAKHSGLAIGVDNNPVAGKFIKAKNAEFVCGTSAELATLCAKRNTVIDLAFIDGDHRSESVMSDLKVIDKFASKDALILFHDTWPANSDDASDGHCSKSTHTHYVYRHARFIKSGCCKKLR